MAGRRGGDEDTRGALLDAGAALVGAGGVTALSLRDVAAKAGVTVAMIRYHFGDKAGFLGALLDHGFAGLALPPAPARQMLRALDAGIAARAWLVRLVVETVYGGGPLAGRFRERHAQALNGGYNAILAAAEAEGILRPGLDPRAARQAMIALLILPRIAGPVWENSGGGSPAEAIENLIFREETT